MKTGKNSYRIHGIPIFKDNIVWVIVREKEAIVVDPGLCYPIETWLKRREISLTGILQTHHHSDHIGGTNDLLKIWPESAVVAAKQDLIRIPFQTISVRNNDQLNLMGLSIKVIEVIGHTNAHIAFHIEFESKNPVLFVGDTLFGAGCGRVFEGTARDMHQALNRINSFPQNTQIYCAHEYTESNLRWASSIDPKDELIKERLLKVSKKRQKGLLSIPTTLEEERRTNLFLRAKSLEEFKNLRKRKDSWKE